MNTPTTTRRQNASLARDLGHAARYYLGRPRILSILAAIAIVAGLAFNWSWLVAAGLAPILISILPCLIMCAVGCVHDVPFRRKDPAPVRDVAEASKPAYHPRGCGDRRATAGHQSHRFPRPIQSRRQRYP